MPGLRFNLKKTPFHRHLCLSAATSCLLVAVGWAEVDLSTKLRYRATRFDDFGLYEKNRQGNQANALEHELRADFFLAGERNLLQLRLGRRLLDKEEFMRPPEEDVIRIHQAYLDFAFPESDNFNLRIGRQELSYNRGILIDGDDWDMEGNSFDALKFYRDGSTWDVDLLYGQLAKDHHNQLAGINLERTSSRRTINEFYLWYFGIPHEQDSLPLSGNPKLEVYNFGTRMEGKLSRPLFYHWMVNYQVGEMESSSGKGFDFKAYNLVANLDYFINHPIARNAGIEYSLSTGDDAGTTGRFETFIPPFANRHVRSGAMDWMSMMNAEMLTFYLFADLHPKVETLLEYHKFYLHSMDSAWYLADLSPAWWGGGKDWPSGMGASKDLGSELDLHLRFGKNPDRRFSLGYSLFFPDKLLTDTNWGWKRDDTVQWAYLLTEFKF
ncbi:MAG: alginate export family protein [Opitutales bacterium]